MGRCYTTSPAPDKQTPCAAHFPPIRSRRHSCPMSLPSRSLVDTFVLWLDRCRVGGALLTAPTESPQQASQTSRGEAANIHITPMKEGGEEKNVTEKRDGEECFVFYYWMGAAGNFTTRNKHPKTIISPPWPCSVLALNNNSNIKYNICVFFIGEDNWITLASFWDKLLLLNCFSAVAGSTAEQLGATIMKTLRRQQIKVTVNTP